MTLFFNRSWRAGSPLSTVLTTVSNWAGVSRPVLEVISRVGWFLRRILLRRFCGWPKWANAIENIKPEWGT